MDEVGFRSIVLPRMPSKEVLLAIQNHMEIIKKYEVEEIRAFATSAIRNASNGEEFVEEVEERQFGFRVRIIPGDREAELIYKGVRQAIPLDEKKVMILDIGGGSNEFIICNQKGIIWKHSFELGMARILELFDLSDPITHEEIMALESYFSQELHSLFDSGEKGESSNSNRCFRFVRHLSFPHQGTQGPSPGWKVWQGDSHERILETL